MDSQFDVFISYNTKDRPLVVRIAEKLQGLGLEVWLDEWQIQPGRSITSSIGDGVRNSRSVVVCIGPHNVGPFQNSEIEMVIMEQVDRGIPAIPLLLPGAEENVIKKLSPLLTKNRWIDFSGGVVDEEMLYWGITGRRPKQRPRPPEAHPPVEPPRDPVNVLLKKLAEKLETEKVTYFLGPGAAFGCEPMPAQGCDIARELLSELEIIGAAYKDLLPPVGVAGLYYSARSGDRDLEKKVMGRMAESSKTFPAAHDQLARLLKRLLSPSRPAPRGGSRVAQLIVTTNFDLMMERALLRAGLSFTRVVQYRSGEQIDVDRYPHVQLNNDGTVQLPPSAAGGEPLRARVDDFNELDAIIKTRRKEDEELSKRPLDSIPWQEMPEPILYKFLGSQEVANSCVLSTSHHYDFPRRVLQRRFIPEHIIDIITNSTTLFLGPWFTDSDFQLTYYTLLRDPFSQSNDIRYALQLPPQQFAADVYRQQMDSRLWEEIKDNVMAQMRIKTIEEDVAQFLHKLCERI